MPMLHPQNYARPIPKITLIFLGLSLFFFTKACFHLVHAAENPNIDYCYHARECVQRCFWEIGLWDIDARPMLCKTITDCFTECSYYGECERQKRKEEAIKEGTWDQMEGRW